MQHSFSGHETFPFRYPWLKKGFDAVLADGNAFLRDDVITILGVGKNMVRSIRHWCLTADVVEENAAKGGGLLQVSELGKLLLADASLDPSLEDPATLWLLHWQIASNRARATTWFWTFSHFHEPDFTREALASALFRWTQTLSGKKVAFASLKESRLFSKSSSVAISCSFKATAPSKTKPNRTLNTGQEASLPQLDSIAHDLRAIKAGWKT